MGDAANTGDGMDVPSVNSPTKFSTPYSRSNWRNKERQPMYKEMCKQLREIEDVEAAPFVATCTLFESHNDPIFGASFCQYRRHDESGLFATVGGNHVCIYEAPLDPSASTQLRLLRTFTDANKKEKYYSVCWTVWDRRTLMKGLPNRTDERKEKLEHYLCFAGEAGIIRVMDVRTSQCTSKMSLSGHGGIVNELRAHPVHHGIIGSASKDQTVRIWCIGRQQCLAILGGFKGHRDQVLSMDFSYCGKYVASGSMDHTVRLWKLDERVEAQIRMALGEGDQEDPTRVLVGDPDLEKRVCAINETRLKAVAAMKQKVKELQKSVEDAEDPREKKQNLVKLNSCKAKMKDLHIKLANEQKQLENKQSKARRLARRFGYPDPQIDLPFNEISVCIHFPVAITGDLHTNYVDCVRIVGDFMISKSSENCIHVWKFGLFHEGIEGRKLGHSIETATSSLAALDHPNTDNWFVKFGLDPRRKWLACGDQKGFLSFWKLGEDALTKTCNFQVAALNNDATIRQVAFEPYGRFLIAVADNYSVSRIDRNVVGGPKLAEKKIVAKRLEKMKRKRPHS